MGLILANINGGPPGFFNIKVGNGGGMGVGSAAPSGGGGGSSPTTYLYWRLYTTSTSAGYWSITELQMRSTSGGSNILSGGTITASSTAGGYPASNALDGNSGTFWLANGNTPPHWIQYQFASAVDVQEVVITPRNDGFYGNETANSFTVQASNDGSTWTDIWEETGITGWSQGTAKTFTKPVSGGGINARVSQVGVEVMASATVANPTVRVSEISVEVMATVP